MRESPFSKYLIFTRAVIQKQLVYRANFLFHLIALPLFTFVNFYLWRAVFASSGQAVLSGFTLDSMILYLFIMPVVGSLVYDRSFMTMSEEVKSGLIATQLIKPYSYRVRLFAESLGYKFSAFLFQGLPMLAGLLIYLFIKTGALPDWLLIGRFILSLTMGTLVAFYFWYMVGILSFYTTNAWGTHLIIGGITMIVSGRLFPLDFLPIWAQTVFAFFPQNSIYYVPAMVFSGHWTMSQFWQATAMQAFWILFLWLASTLFWQRSVKRLTILGG